MERDTYNIADLGAEYRCSRQGQPVKPGQVTPLVLNFLLRWFNVKSPWFNPTFLAGVVSGVCVPPPSLTPLSLKLDYSNFVQNYFGIRQIFCDKKTPDQIDNDVTMTSSLLC